MADLQQSIATEVTETTAILAAITGVSIASQILQLAVICDQSDTGASTFENGPVAGCILFEGKLAFQSAFDKLQSNVESSELSGIPETPSLTTDQAVLQKNLLEAWNSPIGNHTINDLLQPALKYIKPITEYIAAHPWVLGSIFAGPLVIMTFDAAVWMIGFTRGGVALGSIAAWIQSMIGNVPAGSLFSFFQRYGAQWGLRAITLGGYYLPIALIIVFAGILLIESGLIPKVIFPFLEKLWYSISNKIGKLLPSPETLVHTGIGPHETVGASLLIAVLLGAGTFLAMI